ncbi:MAG: hypothetical protein CO186_05550 [Zetaproteobacteria bacterium CG_4_9_14_3_um_filter_49_83]|nr:MAG: hypothetical protein AUJ56_01180 [Zetaproteobacteria bacterium CG1_02_49_23]PIQ33838.1 MAG: hypothetical protein COW62_04155 [Zetaproteobacteria bacterium CG17_big_fil_post_rev_8_21_14_2_50_50_13]PIV29507.1 MAG: hypothetical protein COS35_11725 [Zetaproteobacteria bacterium CG02_land_8_20_14_3_00_50_9]PIY55570.1 MAG: hypothetical protein COZ00_08620 [Zetaproteobacteria bacterium CG_4_10_14_0_8_um_filter_49_80]PJA35462.1 MAG: hypothetical protein CO186_05550 [Zetaproteobacteria bacterium
MADTHIKPGFASHRLGIIALIALMIFAVFYAGTWGVASVGHAFTMWHFESWLKSTNTPEVRTWKLAHEALRWSIKLDENNADYRNDMGRFYEYTAIHMIEHESQEKPLLEISRSYFHDAVRLRPSWGLAWANLALIEHRMGIHDESFYQSMLRAIEFGASVPAVQLTITELAVANWRQMTVPMRKKVLLVIRVGLKSPWKGDFVKIIVHYGMAPYFCLVLPSPERDRLCNS